MPFIRERKEERTGYQNGGALMPAYDNNCDFVMVYRVDDTTAERVKVYREKGYAVHLMTGIAWGNYVDYLYGKYDGTDHWDEAQTDRFGNKIMHGDDTPYMVPTVAFADYLSVKLRAAVDFGVEAIHVEEPEFWDRAGYSPAFRREYELYYREPFVPAYESSDAKYKSSKLKAYLYARTIDRVASSLKEYAKVKYGRDLRFYVPTHSLLNYTQWKIVSPEGKLADIPAVDGCIAQVWTGTSREKNWYDGVFAERTFETSYLEYGVMQELVKGTGRKMWFLHDPIEDNDIFDWDDYRKNYFMTVAASLMHPKVNSFEICPWPNRIFYGEYPKGSPDAEKISESYRTALNNNFNTLGNFETEESSGIRTGILCADSQLYQREYPDSEFSEPVKEITGTVLFDSEELISAIKEKLTGGFDRETMLKYMSSNAFPSFYGAALPLLKYGVPVRPVLLDNVKRYPGYLDDYDVLLMSYEYMKPESPDMNVAVAEWVRRGGTLIYIGDGFDPFHSINAWWSGRYTTAAEHLFEMLGVKPEGEKTVVPCGKGTVGIFTVSPAKALLSKQGSDSIRSFYSAVLEKAGRKAEYKNYLHVSRGSYEVYAVLDESISAEPLMLKGRYADMFDPAFAVVTEKTVKPGENALLLDLDKNEDPVIGTSCRIFSLDINENRAAVKAKGAADLNANMRLKLPFAPARAEINGKPAAFEYEQTGGTVLVSYYSSGEETLITLYSE